MILLESLCQGGSPLGFLLTSIDSLWADQIGRLEESVGLCPAGVLAINTIRDMFTYQGKSLKFCNFSDIEKSNPTFVAQTKLDENMRTILVWRVEEQYYMTIAAV